ncbi:probable G-protein coupled receptor Mth-like 10 isoform X2 [Anoplolepis gracilipes]|uniref:probable G-protein coupled receptor Mth-like 10 isoform X2 n=1 Tax=Anoplolepis gracilipes TaxID=354296 RepID=UPI003BA1F792
MYGKSFKLLYCVLLFFALRPVRNFTIDDKQDENSMRYEFYTNSTRNNETDFKRYHLGKNVTMNKNAEYVFRINSPNNDHKDDSIQYEFHAHYVKYHQEDNQMSMELQANFTKADNKDNSDNENDNKNYIIPHKICENITCIQLCCSLGDRLIDKSCIAGGDQYIFPNVYGYLNDSMQSENRKVDELFQLIVQVPCQETIELPLDVYNKYFEYIFFGNGTLYFPYFDTFVDSVSYCLAVVDRNQFDAFICFEILNETIIKEINNIKLDNLINKKLPNELNVVSFSCRVVSMLCMLTIFLVYFILSELYNIHSFMLRRYASLLFIACTIDVMDQLIDTMNQGFSICVIIGLVNYFCYLASSFWLTAMSFDMWWTFREIRSLRRNVKQQERKKFIYSIFAWGGSSILTIICIIMDFVPSVSKNLIRPGFGVHNCWFHENAAFQLYFHGPETICTISSICLSIYTALKIACYEKNTACHLRDSESRYYNDNKQCC